MLYFCTPEELRFYSDKLLIYIYRLFKIMWIICKQKFHFNLLSKRDTIPQTSQCFYRNCRTESLLFTLVIVNYELLNCFISNETLVNLAYFYAS